MWEIQGISTKLSNDNYKFLPYIFQGRVDLGKKQVVQKVFLVKNALAKNNNVSYFDIFWERLHYLSVLHLILYDIHFCSSIYVRIWLRSRVEGVKLRVESSVRSLNEVLSGENC